MDAQTGVGRNEGEVFAKGWDLWGSGFPGLVRRFCRAEAAVKGGEWDRLKAEATLPWQYFRDPTKNYDCGHDWKVGCVARAPLGAEEGFCHTIGWFE
jgi:hypothetical protein